MPLSVSTRRLFSDADASNIGCIACLSPPAENRMHLQRASAAAVAVENKASASHYTIFALRLCTPRASHWCAISHSAQSCDIMFKTKYTEEGLQKQPMSRYEMAAPGPRRNSATSHGSAFICRTISPLPGGNGSCICSTARNDAQ
jgi:hypothetical protein